MPTKKRTTRRPLSTEKQSVMQASAYSSVTTEDQSFAPTKQGIILVIIVVIIVALIGYFRSVFIVASVNGQQISRLTFYQELERENGTSALGVLINKALIAQEARKQHVSATNQEIDAQENKLQNTIKKEGGNFDQFLMSQSLTRSSLREQIALQILLDKMLGKNIKVSDQEVTMYMDQNKDMLPKNVAKADIAEQIRQQKLKEAVQTWLANLRAKAHIATFITM